MEDGAGTDLRDSDPGENFESNEYLKLRLANIKRNDEFLKSFNHEKNISDIPKKNEKSMRTKRDRPASKKTQVGDDFKVEDRTHAGRVAGISDRRNNTRFESGQLVWSQFRKEDGERLWPAKVHDQDGDTYTVKWEEPDGEDPLFKCHFSKLRERPVCACGNCTASFLENDTALKHHNLRVSSCWKIPDDTSSSASSPSLYG